MIGPDLEKVFVQLQREAVKVEPECSPLVCADRPRTLHGVGVGAQVIAGGLEGTTAARHDVVATWEREREGGGREGREREIEGERERERERERGEREGGGQGDGEVLPFLFVSEVQEH